MTTTCQICGREIKANTGVIAHHGYTRPWHGSGCQTSSCLGARFAPYEQSADRLPYVIQLCQGQLDSAKKHLANLIANPPAKITYRRGDFMGRARGEEITVERPDNFDPNSEGYDSYRPGTYAHHYWGDRRRVEYMIKSDEQWLTHLTKRLADWKEPK